MSSENPQHHRRSVRLYDRDYASPGHYFLTLCTQDRRCLFGYVLDGVMQLNDLGRAVDQFWREIPRHFPRAMLDEHVVMPNHVHGIIQILDYVEPDFLPTVRAVGIPIVPGWSVPDAGHSNGNMRPYIWDVGANNHSPLRATTRVVPYPENRRWNPRGTSRTIGSMVRGFKIAVTRYARNQGIVGDVWQRSFHDHIIRNERSLERIRAYIRDNPVNWGRDRNNPERRD